MRCPSVTFVNSVKTNKYIFNIFTIGSPNHSVVFFPHQTAWQYSDDPPQRGRRMQVGYRQKSRFWALYLASLHAVIIAIG